MILIPVALLLAMLVIQTALVFHARNIVTAAATDAARAAQADGGTVDDGRAMAAQLLDDNGRLLDDEQVTVERSGDRVRAEVAATVVSLIPGWAPTVAASVDAPVETFRPTGAR